MKSLFESIAAIFPITGSAINAITILIGSTIGITAGKKIPEKILTSMMGAMGIFSVYLGLDMVLSNRASTLTILFCFVGGTMIGEILSLHDRFERFGAWLKAKIKSKDERFVDAFVSSSLIFCVGSLAILGSIEEGLGAFPTITITKAIMDGTSSIVFSATLGVGVIFSAASVFVYQAAITLCADAASSLFTEGVISTMSAVGGLMIVCIGLNIIGATKFRTASQLPAIVAAAIAGAFA